jgi:hypothetical protein
MEELDRLLQLVGKFLEAYASNNLVASRTPAEIGECFEHYRPRKIKPLRLNPIVEEVMEELVNSHIVLDALAKEFDVFLKDRRRESHYLLGCEFIEKISKARHTLERKKLLVDLDPKLRSGLLNVYAEHLLADALDEYEWNIRGGASHGEAVNAALELVKKILKGKRPETLFMEGDGPWSTELENKPWGKEPKKAVIAGARVTFLDSPYPELSESFFSIEVPVTNSRQEAAKRILAVTYSLMLVLGGPGPCDLYFSDMPLREYFVELPCPMDPVHHSSLREMAEVSTRDIEELSHVAQRVLELRDEDFLVFATAMKHYWHATLEINEADKVTHLVATLDMILNRSDRKSILKTLPCKVRFLLNDEEAARIIENAVILRNRWQHGLFLEENNSRKMGNMLETVVRQVLLKVLEKMKEDRYKNLVEQLRKLCRS